MELSTIQPQKASMLDVAYDLVVRKLGHIPRRGGSGSMADHCIRVGKTLNDHNYSEETVIAGYLHDVLEDSNEEENHILEVFGANVLLLVQTVTKDDCIKKNKQNRKHLTMVELGGPDAVAIKLADNIDNISEPENINRPRLYLRYSEKIQAIGARVLGRNHPLVLKHLSVLREAVLSLSSSSI